MKKLLISTALAGSLMLGGCASTGGVTTIGFTPQQIAQIQQTAVAICGFLPVVQTVEQVIVATAVPAGLPIAAVADQVGNAICAAVTARSVRLGSSKPMVAGVVVRGSFVGQR